MTIDLKPLPPSDAISFFRAKGLAPPDRRFDFRDVWREEHATQFVVAKAMRTEVLELIRSKLDDALANGGTLATFTADLEPALKKMGWWGEAMERDPLTGELRNVRLGSTRRLGIIFDANMRAAHAAGKWARIQRVKDTFPFLRYIQIQRPTKRASHARYHGLVLPVDDPAWERIYPPNGWRCGCTVQQLSASQVSRQGYEISDGYNVETRSWTNPRTGQVEQIAQGVDPAWDSNAGKTWLDLSQRHASVAGDLPPAAAATELGFASQARLYGLADGREHMGAFDAATGEEIDWRVGQADRVSLGPSVRARRGSGAQVGLVHNHPSSAPISPQDIQEMFAVGISSVLAVGHDGSLYRAKPIRSRISDLRGFGIAIADMVDEAAPDLDADARNHAVRAITANVLQAIGMILYREKLGPQARAIRARVDGVVRAVTAAAISDITGGSQ